ncbi:hypothetical protein A6R68_02001 [Neotoma lepida]|uniref:Claudin n=1 Tax=Neotoma lepida TaxID=56216 RepID=A0A1A6GV16_NEOLE|nr:hypothetical protein A6R68_02001 [Neotoma lepida]
MQYKDHGYWVTSDQGPQVSQVLMVICIMECVCCCLCCWPAADGVHVLENTQLHLWLLQCTLGLHAESRVGCLALPWLGQLHAADAWRSPALWKAPAESELLSPSNSPAFLYPAGEQKVGLELEAASFSLAMLGWLVAIISCGLPLWRVIKVSEETSIWEGLWNFCEADGLKSLRCMTYNSSPVLPQDLEVSQVLVVICIIVTWLGLLLYMIGDERITCVSNMANEEKIMMAATVLFLGVGLLLLVSVSWVTHNVNLGITNPQILSQWKPEMGASLYLGWLSSLLLLLGGALLGVAHLCCSAPTNND